MAAPSLLALLDDIATILDDVAVLTFGVYGLVAAIVKLDDAGLALSRRGGTSAFARLHRSLGGFVLDAAPWLMRFLSIAGTAAMFLVGGGILAHGIPAVHHWTEGLATGGGLAGSLGPVLVNATLGVAVGGALVGLVGLARRIRGGAAEGAPPA